MLHQLCDPWPNHANYWNVAGLFLNNWRCKWLLLFALALVSGSILMTFDGASAYVLLQEGCRTDAEQEKCIKNGSLSFIFILDDIGYNERSFFDRLDAVWPADKKFPIIYLESHGGNGKVAIQVGRILRKHRAIVATGNPFTGIDRFECDSACSLIAMGAVERHLKQVGLHSAHYTLNECKKNEKNIPLKAGDDQDMYEYLEEMGMDPEVFKVIADTPFDKLTELVFDATQPADSQLIVQLGFHMDSTTEYPSDGLPKAAIHREKSHEQVLRYAAEMGNNEAVLGLVDYFLCDRPNRKPNIKAAAEALEIGSHRNFHEASYRLARWMEQGKLGRHRLKEAIRLYRQNAVFGDGQSGARLGWLFYKGRGVKRDTRKALYWFNQSAKDGGYDSYGALCKIHFVGKLVKRDDVETYKWCDLAIANMDEGRVKRDAIRYMHILADRMSDGDIDKAYEEETSYQGYVRRQRS